jgi:hypothetical protein
VKVGPQARASEAGVVVMSPEAPTERDWRGRHSSASGELHAVLHTCRYFSKKREDVSYQSKERERMSVKLTKKRCSGKRRSQGEEHLVQMGERKYC